MWLLLTARQHQGDASRACSSKRHDLMQLSSWLHSVSRARLDTGVPAAHCEPAAGLFAWRPDGAPPLAERGVMGTSACVIQGCCSAASAVNLFSGSHSRQPCTRATGSWRRAQRSTGSHSPQFQQASLGAAAESSAADIRQGPKKTPCSQQPLHSEQWKVASAGSMSGSQLALQCMNSLQACRGAAVQVPAS